MERPGVFLGSPHFPTETPARLRKAYTIIYSYRPYNNFWGDIVRTVDVVFMYMATCRHMQYCNQAHFTTVLR